MMDMMAKTTEGKEVAENPSSKEGHTCQNSEEDPLHSPRFTHHHAQTSQGAYIPEMPPMGEYPYTHTPPLVGQLPNNEPILGVNPTNSILMPKLNDPKGKEKVNESSFKQTSDAYNEDIAYSRKSLKY